MSEPERLALVSQLQDHRKRVRDLTVELHSVRTRHSPDSRRMAELTSAQILRSRIKIALLESQLADA